MDRLDLAYVIGVVLGREDIDGIRVAYTTYMSTLGKWVKDPDNVVQYLVDIGKAKVVKSGQGRSVIFTDREMMNRVNSILTPREDVDPLTLVIEGIRKLANPLSGYADIGDVIKYIEGRLNVPTKEAEEFLVKVIKFHRGRFVFAHGGSRRLKIGSSYYGLVKVVGDAEVLSS
ncbi:hypothetical protein VMUT_2318 [Vulcanisaeta moutnovskia 768-28]|uniref:Uncharacterized protein n=1 Tax=Vulcanisaeta moutnovskia (strain 768-28) TaxID=985053 RepID=F0QY24_VULM7|nr:hypothetical protein [Vulcanisaeta moutnovskia]ADY02510.1 hypothetical protein VMUT_2318 [Vulcanisaeta moutnovskia 768-28]